jgi:2,4-dienoyl-CoA reductase-like NADH-dependent reductase (Old Yellow Enzyme family)
MLPLLFSPIDLRGVTLRNRIVISPMCQYSARDGIAGDWHLVHLGRFALGGAGMVMTEAVAVQERGRITHGDLGLWRDDQIAPLARITTFLRDNGAVPAIQLAHAGRKASMQRPWFGNGPLDASDAARGDLPWNIVAPTAEPVGPGWLMPAELSEADIRDVVAAFGHAARRAVAAGFDVAEVHGAHGYLTHTFFSPLSNRRSDGYGGSLTARMRFPLEVARAVRAAWPADRPVFYRASSVDGADGGLTLDDTVALARALKAEGIDVIDCSSGGIAGSATAAGVTRAPGFQVPFARRIRDDADIRTMAVGLILDGPQAEAVLREGHADLVAIGREALHDPNFALHAARALGCDDGFALWPKQSGWWLVRRERMLGRTS